MGQPIISRRFVWASQSFLAGKEIMSSRTATAFANVRAELENHFEQALRGVKRTAGCSTSLPRIFCRGGIFAETKPLRSSLFQKALYAGAENEGDLTLRRAGAVFG
jgi:hypothetical protein